ncbi:hypothetical protein D3C81_09250 [compost metagenome]
MYTRGGYMREFLVRLQGNDSILGNGGLKLTSFDDYTCYIVDLTDYHRTRKAKDIKPIDFVINELNKLGFKLVIYDFYTNVAVMSKIADKSWECENWLKQIIKLERCK